MPTLVVRDLTKTYGYRHALRGVSFDLAEGEAVALVGANGAGKTTLLRVLAGLARPSGGAVRLGAPDGAPRKHVVPRHMVGYVAHDTMLYDDLSAEANLRLYARLYAEQFGGGRVEARFSDGIMFTDGVVLSQPRTNSA